MLHLVVCRNAELGLLRRSFKWSFADKSSYCRSFTMGGSARTQRSSEHSIFIISLFIILIFLVSGLRRIGDYWMRTPEERAITGLVVNPLKRNQNLKVWKWKEQVLKKVLKETLLKMDKTPKMIFISDSLI